jgi:hypothetical protein
MRIVPKLISCNSEHVAFLISIFLSWKPVACYVQMEEKIF